MSDIGKVRLRLPSTIKAGDVDMVICLWDVRTGKQVRQFTRRRAGILDLAYAPDGRSLA